MGGKYAVVVGVNYIANPEAALKGCCNDARIMVDILKSKGFEDDDIKILVDDDDSFTPPTGANFKNALQWLCSDRQSDDIIFMHFSGHGTQIPSDGDDEEVDQKDEALVLAEMFLVVDDDLKQFFSELPDGCQATVVTDCCHSGSMLDGDNVAISGDDGGQTTGGGPVESSSLMSLLGGSRGVDVSTPRSLPIGTICNILGNKLGTDVPPTGNGVNGALAQVFGGNAGKLMVKFALSQLNKKQGGSSGGGDPLSSLLGGLLGGGKTQSSSTSGGSDPMAAMLGGLMGGSNNTNSSTTSGSGGNPMASILGGLMGGSGASSGGHGTTSGSGDPMSMLSGMLGGMGLQGIDSTASSAPAYKPTAQHGTLGRDVCTLITGCASHETSADVRPPGGDAFGALTKTLSDVYASDPDINFHDLVTKVRTNLDAQKFSQNPQLETSSTNVSRRFIC